MFTRFALLSQKEFHFTHGMNWLKSCIDFVGKHPVAARLLHTGRIIKKWYTRITLISLNFIQN